MPPHAVAHPGGQWTVGRQGRRTLYMCAQLGYLPGKEEVAAGAATVPDVLLG